MKLMKSRVFKVLGIMAFVLAVACVAGCAKDDRVKPVINYAEDVEGYLLVGNGNSHNILSAFMHKNNAGQFDCIFFVENGVSVEVEFPNLPEITSFTIGQDCTTARLSYGNGQSVKLSDGVFAIEGNTGSRVFRLGGVLENGDSIHLLYRGFVQDATTPTGRGYAVMNQQYFQLDEAWVSKENGQYRYYFSSEDFATLLGINSSQLLTTGNYAVGQQESVQVDVVLYRLGDNTMMSYLETGLVTVDSTADGFTICILGYNANSTLDLMYNGRVLQYGLIN